MKSFLGLPSYYRKFIKGFSKIIAPMTNLLKDKSNMIDWTLKCDSIFLTLKSILTQTLVLAIMNLLK